MLKVKKLDFHKIHICYAEMLKSITQTFVFGPFGYDT